MGKVNFSLIGGLSMKLICKCGNVEELKTDNNTNNFEIKKCEDGTVMFICKNCSEVVFVNFKNK